MTNERWLFLGVDIEVLTAPGAPVLVARGVLPVGASPPFHVHDDLDDSFYVLDGDMVIRCGDDVWRATSGEWVQFPRGVPHTFRVLGRPAHILIVHAHDSFMGAVRAIGQRVRDDGDTVAPTQARSPEEIARAFAAHAITDVGPCMEQDEAERWLGVIAAGRAGHVVSGGGGAAG